MPDPTEANGDIVMGVAELLRREDQGVDSLAGNVKVMIDRGAWRSFRDPKGEPHTYEAHEFGRFVTEPEYAGLGFDAERFVTFVKDDPGLAARVRELLTGEHGGDRGNQHTGGKTTAKIDTVKLGNEPGGNSAAYQIRRLLKAGRQDLVAKIESGELKAAAAVREAGLKQRPERTVRIDSPTETLRALLRVYTLNELRDALVTIESERDDEQSE